MLKTQQDNVSRVQEESKPVQYMCTMIKSRLYLYDKMYVRQSM